MECGSRLLSLGLLVTIAKALEVDLELVKATSSTPLPLLVSGNIDLSPASMTHTRERAIDFSIT
jgi:ABC-type amino acid transport substrate-binding protein